MTIFLPLLVKHEDIIKPERCGPNVAMQIKWKVLPLYQN